MAASKELFRALEFAHYAERFRDRLFVVALSPQTPFHDLLHDLKVLAGYHIQVLLVSPDPDFQLDRIIGLSNKRGTRFHLSLATEVTFAPEEGRMGLDLGRLQAGLQRGQMPVIAYHGAPPEQGGLEPTFALAGQLAVQLGANKLYLMTPQVERWMTAVSRTQVLAEEISRVDAELSNAGIQGQEPLLSFVHRHLMLGVPDIVVVEGRASYLFKEVFTHDGAGMLFTKVKPARIRKAEIRDITDITLLLTPEIEAGRILSIDENEIEADIGYYTVYEIDGLLVGMARLKLFGSWAELAQFAMLPRYRGKGRARDLALKLIEQARAMGLRAVFALSIDPRMWEFFTSLGFQGVDRAQLPETWRAHYDMGRPSRAFLREL